MKRGKLIKRKLLSKYRFFPWIVNSKLNFIIGVIAFAMIILFFVLTYWI